MGETERKLGPRSTVRVRSARAEDAPAMLEITRDVWEGTDYVPAVWQEWLEDAQGYLQVAELDGRVVGLHHTALHSDGTAWAEGIRVAEDARGRGVGEAMLQHATAWATERGCRAIRLSTTSQNDASNRVSQKAGLKVVGGFAAMSAVPGDASLPIPGVSVGLPQQAPEIWAWLGERTGRADGRLFYTEGWTAYELTEKRLQELLAMSAVVVTAGEGIEAVAIATAQVQRPAIRLGLVRGGGEGVERLGSFLRVRAREGGLSRVRATVEVTEEGRDALLRAGFEDRGMEMLLHERSLP